MPPGAPSIAYDVAPSGWPIVGDENGRPVAWINAGDKVFLPRSAAFWASRLNDTGWMVFAREGLLHNTTIYPLEELADLQDWTDVVPTGLNDSGVVVAYATDGDGEVVSLVLTPERD